jgi:hypothetical protein
LPQRIDIDFIGYTYKGDVEHERSLLVNVLKELDSMAMPDIATQPKTTKA